MAAPTKQYGLILPQKKGLSKTLGLPKPSVFGDDSDEETSVGESLQKEAIKKKMMKQTRLEMQKALEQDSTVYDYDGVYDDIQKQRLENHKKILGGADKKPKYIHQLMKAVDERKKEQERREERKIQKEREAEGEKFADKDAYKCARFLEYEECWLRPQLNVSLAAILKTCSIMLPPVKKDRVITHLPKCFSPHAALHTKEGFHPKVKAACQTQKAGALSFNVAKVIVVGDVAVGKTCLISRFCKGAFDKNYKATIGVDFEMERFEVLGVPFSLQLWDTAGQERFKCIASTPLFLGLCWKSASHFTSACLFRQWLEDAMKENDPSSVLLFLAGTKKDLSTPDQLNCIEQEAIRLSEEIKAEYWAVSAKSGGSEARRRPHASSVYRLFPDLWLFCSGDGVRDFFLRVASLTFEANILAEIEKSGSRTGITDADHKPKRKSNCC
ncbi:Ras-related protein Rab-34 [Oryzias melastigma]|uniref:Nuclear speckle splicing regulatory protein 1 n=1 Tax=Oryzias melastigma TaxID=30732 RepID=A0A834BWW8_ORYME|nr:Ras-related protein Rab-34 [Oryzias melastigma]